ncbi:Arginine N-methyltransferase 2 [Oleoguttula sp. CCFEE 5521]
MSNEIDTDTTADEILLAATNHDIDTLTKLLREPGAANVQDPDTGYAPLHAAVASCEADTESSETNGEGDAVHNTALSEESAVETVKFLFENGAIWNELDANDETPGCIAKRLGLEKVYEEIVRAGVRAEMLFNRLDEYTALGDDEDDEDEESDEDDEQIDGFEPSPSTGNGPTVATSNGVVHDPVEGFEPMPNPSKSPTSAGAPQNGDSSVPELVQTNENGHTTEPIEANIRNPNVNSEDYLTSELSYSGDRLLDSDKNAVMMDWETEIMFKSVERLVLKSGLRTMNVGFGMGIVDGAFLAKDPQMHHIIEAHPQVHQRMKEKGWYDKENVHVHEGKWQDVLPKLLEQGVVLDAIYFDTYAEDYKDLKIFFQDYVIGLLDSDGLFGFYNGLGADRQVCYDVYTRIVEMDLFNCGLDTEWLDIKVPEQVFTKEEWKDVRHKYWDNVNPYRLPTCKFLG